MESIGDDRGGVGRCLCGRWAWMGVIPRTQRYCGVLGKEGTVKTRVQAPCAPGGPETPDPNRDWDWGLWAAAHG